MAWHITKKQKTIRVTYFDNSTLHLSLSYYRSKNTPADEIIDRAKSLLSPLIPFSQSLLDNLPYKAKIQLKTTNYDLHYSYNIFSRSYKIRIANRLFTLPIAEIYAYATSPNSDRHASQLADHIADTHADPDRAQSDFMNHISEILSSDFNLKTSIYTYTGRVLKKRILKIDTNPLLTLEPAQFITFWLHPYQREILPYTNFDIQSHHTTYFWLNHPDRISSFVRRAKKLRSVVANLKQMLTLFALDRSFIDIVHTEGRPTILFIISADTLKHMHEIDIPIQDLDKSKPYDLAESIFSRATARE
ncbi:MAG: hypothetical protein DRH04_05680 [Deltaproteobacteria bacterium]|nr:MAG: hypothetical protein DRH04_05680 [Deltaproteobacteria bacterium]